MTKRTNKNAVIETLLDMLLESGMLSFEIESRIQDLYYDDVISASYADELCSYIRSDGLY